MGRSPASSRRLLLFAAAAAAVALPLPSLAWDARPGERGVPGLALVGNSSLLCPHGRGSSHPTPLLPGAGGGAAWRVLRQLQQLVLPTDPAGTDKVWPPFEPNVRVIIASVIAFFGAALSNAGGVGGGGLFVPMFNLLLGYDAKTSAALSKSMIMGGAIASMCFNVQLKHPTKELPLINYDIARLMQPMLLLGISIGVLLNVIMPPWVIVGLLFILLLAMTSKTLQKGVTMYRKEHEKKAIARAATLERETAPIAIPEPPAQAADIDRQKPSSVPGSGSHSWGSHPDAKLHDFESAGASGMESNPDDDGDKDAADEEAEAEAEAAPAEESVSGSLRQPLLSRSPSLMEKYLIGKPREVPIHELVDWWGLLWLLLVWVIYLTIQVLESVVVKCGPVYWTFIVLQIPVSLTATGGAVIHLHKKHQRRLIEEGHLGDDEDVVNWEYQNLLAYPLYALLAGTCGGMLGIGGGMVMGPVLLELGLKPQVTSATSTFIVVFSSSLSVVEFYLLGRIPLNVAVYFCVICVAASLVGLSVVRSYVIRSGKASIIVFILGAIIGVSGIMLGTLGSVKIYREWEAGTGQFGFRSICESH